MKAFLKRKKWVSCAVMIMALMTVAGTWKMAAGAEQNSAPEVSENEEAWIIGDVARDLGQLMAFTQAKENGGNTSMAPPVVTIKPQDGGTGERAFTVTVQPVNGTAIIQDVTVSGSPWEPGAYQPWVKSLAEAWHVRSEKAPTDAMTDDAWVTLLEDSTVENILQANRTLSTELTKAPGNAGLHEQAGLLLGLLAWAEPNSYFSDPRELQDSASAHLAMAELLRGGAPAGTAGQLAEMTMSVLTGRQAEADEKMDALSATANLPQSTQEWVQALRLQNWGDWRKLTPGPEASLLLCWEYSGEMESYVGDLGAAQFLSQMPASIRKKMGNTIMDWTYSADDYSEEDLKNEKTRIAKIMHALGLGPAPDSDDDDAPSLMSMLGLNMVHDRSTEVDATPRPETDTTGNTTPPDATDAANATEASNATVSPVSVADNTTLFLNEIHTGPWVGDGVAVASPGGWGAREQRYLLFLLAEINHNLMGNNLASKAAAQFRQREANAWVRNLRMGPMLGFYLAANPAQYNTAMSALAPLMVAHPEWVSAANWQRFRAGRGGTWKSRTQVPDYADWFNPWMPDGTTFDAYYRMDFPEMFKAKPELFQPWIKLAPNDENLEIRLLTAETGGNLTAEQLRATFGPMVDYSVTVGLMVANASLGNMTAYQEAMQPVCDWNSGFYLDMGKTLLEHGMDEQAAAAYQKAADHFDDSPILMSNDMDFLVNYYFDHGKKDEAMAIAQQAADVNSECGLQTLARLEVRQGNFTAALKTAQESDRSYNDIDGRLMVYNAWASQTDDPKIKRLAAQFWAKASKGLTVVKQEDLAKAPAPTDGVQLVGESSYTTNAGLKKGDKVVAINGRRVHNQNDATWVFFSGALCDYQVIFWRDGQYVEKTIHLPELLNGVRWGMSLKNFKAKAAA